MENEAVTQEQFRLGLAEFKTELKAEIRTDIAQLKSEMIKWVIGLYFGSILVVGTLIGAYTMLLMAKF